MPQQVNYGDHWEYLHEEVARALGVDPAGADAQTRAINNSWAHMLGALTKVLVDKGTVTDNDLQSAWVVALTTSYENVSLQPVATTGTRSNKSTNPACANDATGWLVDAGTGTRTAVSGFDRANVYRAAGAAVVKTPHFTVSPGEVWTLSAWLQCAIGAEGTFEVFAQFYSDAGGTTDVATSVPVRVTISTGAVPTRVSTTVTVPPNGPPVSARLVIQVANPAGPNDFTMALAEYTPELRDYFDGGTVGASWDGTAGSSASTWVVS